MQNEYYYNEPVARFYDVVYDSMEFLKPGQKFYHEEIMASKGPVLEAGAGSGRIFVPALEAGANIYGIDLSENMLKQLKKKIPENEHHRVTISDIRNFNLSKEFELVISPFRVFQHFLQIEDQLNALNCIYEHLKPGGRLIFDVFNPDLKRLVSERSNLLEYDGEYKPGMKLQRYATIEHDKLNQVLNVTFKFVWDEDGDQKQEEFYTPLRYYFRFELENLIARTKFKLEKIYGDFERNELSSSTKEFVIVCRKQWTN